jgi:hypothetical protein
VACLTVFLWNLAGREIIELNQTTLRRVRQISLIRHSKEFRVANIAKSESCAGILA